MPATTQHRLTVSTTESKRKTWGGGCETGHPLYSSSLAISITQLLHRLFLEFRFYNPHTVILPAPVTQTHTPHPLPKILSARSGQAVLSFEKQFQVTPNSPRQVLWQALFRKKHDDSFEEDSASG